MTTLKEWMASTGPVCKKCGREYFKGRDGLCMPCWEWEREHDIEYRIPEGLNGLIPMTSIKEIVHKTRKE